MDALTLQFGANAVTVAGEDDSAARNFSMGSRFSRTLGWSGFPDAIIAAEHGAASRHPDFAAAKAGDDAAAERLVNDLLTDRAVAKIRAAIGDRMPTLVPVYGIEATGNNRIPNAFAEALAARLGLPVDDRIVQSTQAKRSGKDGFYRLANQQEFYGEVAPGEYIIVDDTLAQGGTVAQLKEHIEKNGGKVILAAALTGKQFSARIAPTASTLNDLRGKYGELEQWWRAEFGYGFDGLTESEARFLAKSGLSADAIRNRILAARKAGIADPVAAVTGSKASRSAGAAERLDTHTLQSLTVALRTALNNVSAGIGDALLSSSRFRVLSLAQLPADVKEEAATLDAEGEIRAWVDNDGTVNFVADNLHIMTERALVKGAQAFDTEEALRRVTLDDFDAYADAIERADRAGRDMGRSGRQYSNAQLDRGFGAYLAASRRGAICPDGGAITMLHYG